MNNNFAYAVPNAKVTATAFICLREWRRQKHCGLSVFVISFVSRRMFLH